MIRRAVPLVWLVVALASAPAFASPIPPTAEEEAQLRAQEVVVRPLTPPSGGGVHVLAIVDVPADRDAVFAALMDFEGRRSNPAVKGIEDYRPPTADERWIKWTVSRFGFEVVYHNHYRLDRASGRLTHELDPTKPNDLRASTGVYDVRPSPAGPGLTRLTYEVTSDFGAAVPDFLQSWMSSSGTRDFMADMARRARARVATP